MRFLKGILLVVLCCLSCTEVNRSPKPEPFYDQGKMVDIMTDMYLMEGVLSLNRKAFLKASVRPDSFLFKKYKMDSLSYAKNFNYYIDRVDEYQEILEQVSVRLDTIKSTINKEELERSLSTQLLVKEDSIVIDTVNKKQLRIPRNNPSPKVDQ
jgi:hypothetical protein